MTGYGIILVIRHPRDPGACQSEGRPEQGVNVTNSRYGTV